MVLDSYSFPWLLTFIAATAAIFAFRLRSKKHINHPPGPPTIPFIGNNHCIEGLSQLKLAQWLEEQGPIVRLVLNGKNWIGINSLEIANKLLVKNGNIFSSRPFFPLLSDLVFNNDAIAIMPYGHQWRKHRRFMHNFINPTTVDSMEPMMKQELEVMLAQIDNSLEETDLLDVTQFICDYSFRVIVKVLFGNISIAQHGNEQPFRLFRSLGYEAFKLLTPPKLNWTRLIPFSGKYSKAELQKVEQLKTIIGEFILGSLDQVRQKIKDGIVEDNIASKYLDSVDRKTHELDEQEFVSFIINLLLAGVQTVGDNLAWAVAAITKHHDQQMIAHKQLDSLNKFPTLSDAKTLTSIQNILKESLRLFPSVVLNIPRESTEDFQYEGYDIPCGSSVVVNIYAINRDPQRYPNPDCFNPSRYDSHTSSTELDPFSFGMGRRLCPGINLAKAEMFCVISALLYKYEFIEHPDCPILLNTDGDSLTNSPLPFRVQLKKRHIVN